MRISTILAAAVTAATLALSGPAPAGAVETAPILIGLDGEFGLKDSTSAQAIEQGIDTAIAEINAAGGVLGGRKLALVTRDNRSVPARSQFNLRQFAGMTDLVAVFGGRFSPVMIADLPLVKELGLILLDPWGSADGITDNDMTPNYVFRLSLRDSYAMPAMIGYAKAKGIRHLGLMVPNTAWGRSNAAAAATAVDRIGGVDLVDTAWYNWGEPSMIGKYQAMVAKGAEGILLVANDIEAAQLVREMGALPPDRWRPIICHWGVTGGRFAAEAEPALGRLDFTVVQTFSFLTADPAKVARFMQTYTRLYGPVRAGSIPSAVGVAQAYDLTHILALAIDLAGTTDRAAVRDALEKVRDYDGLVRRYDRPFSPASHDALRPENVFMAVYRADGTVAPVSMVGR